MSLFRIGIISTAVLLTLSPFDGAVAAPAPVLPSVAPAHRGLLDVHLGNDSNCAGGNYDTALGASSRTRGDAATAIGAESYSGGANSVAIGNESRSQQSGLAAGAASLAGQHSTALGDGARATPDNAIALGDDAQASASYSTAIGVSGRASGYSSMALGNDSQASYMNSIALGANSQTARVNSVSIGAPGSTRQLTNLSAGTQATDAVNVSQLQRYSRNLSNTERNDMQAANARLNRFGHAIEGRVNRLQQQMTDQHNESNGGIASVAAMADIPYTTRQTFSVGVGVANYQNANAVAVGAQYQITPRTDIRLASAWNSAEGNVVGAGIAYGW
ncbi:YadA-like family protein [Edwardsiella piscicida]|nr:YadA-like family protein [Edwardsiella piscicida]ELM3728879.1 YadA-like family protein [Edwardsiella piscicida]ELV7535723.1 YadA-like family protein [Edwardsiella piscicida]